MIILIGVNSFWYQRTKSYKIPVSYKLCEISQFLRGKLKLQYFGHLMRRVDSLDKTLMLGGLGAEEEGDDRRQRKRWLDGITDSMDVWVNSGRWWWTGRPGVLWFMGLQSRTRLSDWTALNWTEYILFQVLSIIACYKMLDLVPCACGSLFFSLFYI